MVCQLTPISLFTIVKIHVIQESDQPFFYPFIPIMMSYIETILSP